VTTAYAQRRANRPAARARRQPSGLSRPGLLGSRVEWPYFGSVRFGALRVGCWPRLRRVKWPGSGSVHVRSLPLGWCRLGWFRLGWPRVPWRRVEGSRSGSVHFGSRPVGRCRLGSRRLGSFRLGWRRAEGSATAELAASLPALVLLLFAALTAVLAVRVQLECVDAAREAARAAARGESGVAAGQRVAPAGASVSVAVDGDTVRATVRVQVHPLGGHMSGFELSATAVAAKEPDPDPLDLGGADVVGATGVARSAESRSSPVGTGRAGDTRPGGGDQPGRGLLRALARGDGRFVRTVSASSPPPLSWPGVLGVLWIPVALAAPARRRDGLGVVRRWP
jgi:hypothetical protein